MICRNHVDVAEGIRRCARCQTPYCRNCLVEIQGRPFCATCKSEQLLDVRSGLTSFATLQYAGVWNRFAAVFLDWIIIAIPVWIISIMVALGASQVPVEVRPFTNLLTLPLMFVQLGYEGLMYSNKNGQTLGKIATRVRVVQPDGSPITTGQAWGRAAMKFVLGCLCFIDYIPAFFTAERTTLHDMVAGTRVVEVP
jgi:uncharacterized RDD family membrane protein YckC